ncbi:MAG: hypothetical protein JW864_01560 [Spirochaetes bacterium]|nr:hypothetical protein [Spirochaetota bacterium]
MKKKITAAIIFTGVITLFSCSTQLIRDTVTLKGIKNTGIIIRISRGSKISKDDFIQNTLYWLSNYEKNENITVIRDASEDISYYKYTQERFYQLSNENEYLKYKSIGVVNLYLQNNRNELSRIMHRHNLDSLVIYEVYNIISTEMQFLDFDSVIAVVDPGLNIAYLDHFTDHYDSTSTLLDELKNQMMDKINTKLMQDLQYLNLLGGRTEAAYKASSKPAEAEKPEELPTQNDEKKENADAQGSNIEADRNNQTDKDSQPTITEEE